MENDIKLSETSFKTQKLKQPKALYLLFFVQMWESFSYYGMRAILVLYMIDALGFDDLKTFGIYAIYIALAECLGIFGGRLADKVLGLRKAIYLGGAIIAFGHLVLSTFGGDAVIYLSLSLIAVGTGLFRTNCTTLLGEFYLENDPRRDSGYTLFYVGLNIGAFLATILCAYTADTYGWHYGFSLATLGMLTGLITLYKMSDLLENKGLIPKQSSKKKITLCVLGILAISPLFSLLLYFYNISNYMLFLSITAMIWIIYRSSKHLPKDQKRNITQILITALLLAVFYGFEEQVGSSLIVFSERYADKTILGFNVPASALSTFNPLTILILGPIVALLLEKYELRTGKTVNIFSKIAMAFLIQGVAFIVLYLNTIISNKVPSIIVVLAMSLIAFSELFIGPAVYAFCSEKAPKHMKGVLMGAVILGYSLANLFSGAISQFMAISNENINNSLQVYSSGFFAITVICLASTTIIYMLKFALSFKGMK